MTDLQVYVGIVVLILVALALAEGIGRVIAWLIFRKDR